MLHQKPLFAERLGQDKYQNLHQLLKPSSILRDIKLSNRVNPSIYTITAQQTIELLTLKNECGLQIIPFTWLIINVAEDFQNIYKKILKVK